MQPDGEFMKFDSVECGWGLQPQEPIGRAEDIHVFLETRVLDIGEQIQRAQADTRYSEKGRVLELALDRQRLARSVKQVWQLMIDRGIITAEDELHRIEKENEARRSS